MKNFLIVFFALTSFTVLFGQDEETLLEVDEIESGGYGALSINFTNVKKEFGVMVGGYGGWLINHKFMIGGGGFGLANNIKAADIAQTDTLNTLYIKQGYGGLILEYIINSNQLVHYTVQTLIGGGAVTYSLKDEYDVHNDQESNFFVWEIGANLEVNVIKYFRLAVGGKYKLVSGVDLVGLNDSDLSGFNASVSFKFGSF